MGATQPNAYAAVPPGRSASGHLGRRKRSNADAADLDSNADAARRKRGASRASDLLPADHLARPAAKTPAWRAADRSEGDLDAGNWMGRRVRADRGNGIADAERRAGAAEETLMAAAALLLSSIALVISLYAAYTATHASDIANMIFLRGRPPTSPQP